MTQDQLVVSFLNMFFSMLLEHTPVDTGNLASHTRFEIVGNEAIITVEAPSLKVDIGDYAAYVNYCTKIGNTNRNNKNYHYIEKNILQAAELLVAQYGGVIQNDL